MTTRRQSAFAGKSAVSPASNVESAAQGPQEPVASTLPAAAASASQESSEASGQAPRSATKGAKKKKVSFYQLPAEEDRAKAAWMHTMGHTGHTTITSFFEAAVSEYTRKLEERYNDSKPFN